jgi:hypothetical protein
VDKDLYEIFRTETEFKGKSYIYRGTTPRSETNATIPDKILRTQEEMAFQTIKNHGIHNAEVHLIGVKEEKARGVDVESTTRKTKCNRH